MLNLKSMWMVRILNYIEPEIIQRLLNDLSGHLKISFLKGLKMMKRRVKNIYNGQIIFLKFFVHSATGLTPNEARKEKNEFKAKLNVSVKARKERTYPTLEVGGKVKIMRKKAITEKERTSNWLAGEYVVEEIFERLNQKYYRLTGYNRPLMRHELLKV